MERSRRLVDPELLPLLESLPPFELSAETLPQIRALMAGAIGGGKGGDATAGASSVRRLEQLIPGPPGAPDVRVLAYLPKATCGGAFLHLHGGGFVMGAPEGGEGRNRLIARETGCVVVSVDYRLAPETPFPGAVEDAYAALRWLHANASRLGVDPSRIAVGGESAGGGLAAALALLARARGEVPVAHQHLMCPMLDDRPQADPHPYAGEFAWRTENNRFGWAALLGGPPGRDGLSPYAAPARAGDLTGLPPAFIAVGALDLFLEENLEYARRLTRAGVPVELHVYPGAFHGFHLAAHSGVARRQARDELDALRRAIGTPGR